MNTHLEAVRTCVRDELRRPSDGAGPRGIKHWSSVELLGEAWFVVEGAVQNGEQQSTEVRRWVCASVAEAVQRANRGGYLWVRLMAYAHAPVDLPSGYAFGEVTEVLRSEQSHGYVLKYRHGVHVFLRRSDETSAPPRRIEGMRRVYLAS
jgi:hypothetical protein